MLKSIRSWARFARHSVAQRAVCRLICGGPGLVTGAAVFVHVVALDLAQVTGLPGADGLAQFLR